MGLIPALLSTWRAPRQAIRRAAGMSDPAILALLIGAMAVYFVAQWPGHARAAVLDPSVPLQARLGGALLATLFLMPLLVIALAGVVALLARAAGLALDGRHSRLALVWALAAVAPAMLLAGLVNGLVGPGPELTLVHVLAGAAFLWFWVSGLRALMPRGERA